MYVVMYRGRIHAEYRGIRSEGVGKACRKRYCQLDWCFDAARRAIIRKGRTTSVHHIWQTFPNMVTSTSKYGSRGRPLVAPCNNARAHSRLNIASMGTRALRFDRRSGRLDVRAIFRRRFRRGSSSVYGRGVTAD